MQDRIEQFDHGGKQFIYYDLSNFRSNDQFETRIREEYDIRISRFPRHAIRTVWRYLTRAGPETNVRVYAVGGDGILFDCFNGLVGLPNAEFALIPRGRINDFVRSFGEGLADTFRDIPLLASAPTLPTVMLGPCLIVIAIMIIHIDVLRALS
ncbi:MAG: acylglycerol kinase family protein [Treponema sp.]|jgi:hypothetical protein|nr:acylglycerol kinase family protein [Treponema sp.]